MGNSVFKRYFVRRDVKVLFIGLDGAGKTAILYRLKYGESRPCTPTVGFNTELVRTNNIRMTCWDVGLRDRTRDSMKHYLPGTNCLVFVVDSADTERFDESLTYVLESVCREPEAADIPVLVLANKQDLANAMEPEKIKDNLESNGCLSTRRWQVLGFSAVTGIGTKKALNWLNRTLANSTKHGEINRSLSQVSVSVQDKNDDVNCGEAQEHERSFFTGLISSIRRALCRK